MTALVLNGVTIPEFTNFDEVLDLVDRNKDKIYLHFLEGDSKFERNAILSRDESQNTEYTEFETKHCVRCMSISDSISCEEFCEDCDEDEDDS